MSRETLKSCVAVALTLSLLYSGVAWAVEWCLRHNGHSGHAAVVEDHHQSQATSEFDHHQDTSVPVIHCAPMTEEVGPAARVASAEIRRSDRGLSLHAASANEAISAALGNDLWLEALFKRIITFSSPTDLSRHLFLSVLQI